MIINKAMEIEKEKKSKEGWFQWMPGVAPEKGRTDI